MATKNVNKITHQHWSLVRTRKSGACHSTHSNWSGSGLNTPSWMNPNRRTHAGRAGCSSLRPSWNGTGSRWNRDCPTRSPATTCAEPSGCPCLQGEEGWGVSLKFNTKIFHLVNLRFPIYPCVFFIQKST
jgi:hypothetical protein